MELLRALPYDGFRFLEGLIKPARRVSLEGFTDAVSEACLTYGVDSSIFNRRAIQSLFHHIDFNDNKYVTWEEVTTHMIDDSLRVMSATHSSDAVGMSTPSRSELQMLDHVGLFRQAPNAKVRSVKYVGAWERMLRVVHHSTSQDFTIEMTTLGSVDRACKVSKPMVSCPTILEAITDHHIVVAAHQDMSCSVHGAQVLREGSTVTSMALHRVLPMRETEESTTALLWHPTNKVLYSGFRTGTIAPWNLRLDKNTFTDRYNILGRQSLFNHPVSALVAFEDKLVASSIASVNNIVLYDVTKNCVLETLKGHNLGVTTMSRVDGSDLIVTGGFERVPHLWILKIRDFPPWKLVDKAEPHRGNIVQVHAPPLSNKILSSDDRGVIKLWDIRTMRCVQTMFGDQPPLPKPGQSASTTSSHFHSTAFHISLQTIVSCGPQNLHHFRGNIPEYMDGTDAQPLSALLYHPTHEAFFTAHGRTVKVWNQHAGALSTQYTDIAPNTITAMTLDSRGRKFFLGTNAGDVEGYNMVTGTKFRSFRHADSEIIAMTYAMLRNGSKYVLAATQQEMLVYDDVDVHGRQQVLTTPLQHIRLQITKRFEDPEEAERRAALVTYRGMLAQSKLSMCVVWARWYVVIIDLHSLTVVHCFDIDGNDVVAVSTLGDLPAIAVLDHKNVLYVYAVRPCLSAGTLLLRRDLNQVGVDNSLFDKRTRHSILQSRKLSMRRLSEDNSVKSAVSEFVPQDGTMPTGQHGCIMHFHHGKRVIYISDSNGMLWEWSIGDFIKQSALTSMHYPLQSITDQILRRSCNALSPQDARKAVRLVKAHNAHSEEIKFLVVVFHNSRTRVVTGSQDCRVVAWDVRGRSLGELSQGRFLRPELVTDKDALEALYQRYNVQPWTFPDAEPDDDIQIIDDMPPHVLTMLRRVAARYRGRKGTFNRNKNISPLSPRESFAVPDEKNPSGFAFVAPATENPEGDNDVIQTRLHPVVICKDAHEDEEAQTEASSPNVAYGAFLKACGLDDGESPFAVSPHEHGGITPVEHDDVRPLATVPRAKFRVRGPLIKTDETLPPMRLPRRAELASSNALISPRGVHQTVTKRADLPLTMVGVTSQHEATCEERERHVAKSLHLNWDFYSRIVLKGARHVAQQNSVKRGNGDDDNDDTPPSPSGSPRLVNLAKSEEAKQMRCVYVPPIPPTKPPSRPSGVPQGRVPLTARDQEKFAVARLLGEDHRMSEAPTMAMDDFHLSDKGAMRL